MSKVIGIASEGPTDYLVLKMLIDRITGEENRYLHLQPEADMMGRYGNGWKGVWKWCKETAPLDVIMDSVEPRIDIVVIQMDGDVVRKEKEVHCLCESTICDEKGKVFPLYCERAISGLCPVELPCQNHSCKIHDVINHGKYVLDETISISDKSRIIITIPCDSTDAWIVAAYDNYGDIEKIEDPWRSIIAKRKYYHDVRVRGDEYMILSDKDGRLFYQLWLPLLDYVNEKYKVNKKLKNIAGADRLDPVEVKQVANVLWDNVSIIDEYLKKYGEDILEEHKQIILGWKQRIQGRFVMERHLKKGSIFISLEDANVYLVRGIISGWEEMFPAFPLPLVVEATFIPFRDVIISDGIVAPYMISIGKNMAVDFKNAYMDAKKNNKIIQSLLTNEFMINHVMSGDKNMIYKMWKKFDKLVEKCYGNMIGADSDDKCWEHAFELLREIVLEERKTNPQYARQMDAISEDMDSDYDILGWLEDCLDEMDMKGKYQLLLHMCDELLKLFNWSEYICSDIKFRRSSALEALGREKEAVDYCTKWIRKEPDNIMAATAGIYAFIATQKYEQAEELVDLFIPNKTMCTAENSIMFTATSKLYEAMGRTKEKKQVDKALEAYDEYLEEYFENLDCDDWDDDDDEFWDNMPFY